jgi:AbrB family looped-hinge helix DNA binding protein
MGGPLVTTPTAKLTEKFQITIPAAVRRRLGLKAGDVVFLAFEKGEVVLRAAAGGWTEGSRGLGKELWRKEGGAAAIERERSSWK